jgi:hypothetical protein
MSSDADLVTFGLCVHVATTATEQSSYYTILISEVCSSAIQTHTQTHTQTYTHTHTHTHRIRYLNSYLCRIKQIHNYTLSGNRYEVTDKNIAKGFVCKSSGVQDFIIYSYKIHFIVTISNQSRFLGSFAKLRKTNISFVMFVCRSVRMEQLSSPWTDFHEK